MSTTLNMTLKLRRAEFAESCVLLEGEPGFHTTTKELKIGDGKTTWDKLPFANQTQIEALIKAVDDKVADLDDIYATDAELEAVRSALDAAKLDKTTYNAYVQAHENDYTNTQIDAKFNPYRTSADQDAIDAAFATKEALKEVTDELATYGDIVTRDAAEFATAAQGAKADAAAVKADVDAALGERYTKTEADGKVATAKSEAIAAAKTETETQISTFKTDVTDVLDGRIDSIEGKLDNVSNVMDFVGAGATLPAAEDSHKGDVFVINEGDNAGKEYVFDGTTWVEFGYATGNENAIAALQGRMDTAEADIDKIEAKPAMAITSDDIGNWNAEIGAKELAASKTTTAEVKAQIEAYGYDTISSVESKISAAEESAKGYTDTEISDFNTETVAPIAARVKAIENAPYATTANVATAKQEAIDAAKDYADSLDHEDTTYTVAATDNALEFTVTPDGKGEAKTIKLVAPTVNTGVMSITAGTDIVVTPGEDGEVEIAHKDYGTGTLSKDPAALETGDAYVFTGLDLENGHVTGGAMKSLADILDSMTFILDGGTSAN